MQNYSPERWAFEITKLLNVVLGAEHFPLDIPTIAQDYSRQMFSDNPIAFVKGDSLPGFDGALYPLGNSKGWGIIYNNDMASRGRINFTLAHEFGHYLLHRQKFPNGLECGQQDMVRWDSEYKLIEQQANVFAANLLMPLDDFRRQIPSKDNVTLDMISGCADRYRVSLIAAALRWIQYTEKRAVLVVSTEGYALWARSSKPAYKSGIYIKTSGSPYEIPSKSIAVKQTNDRSGVKHGKGVWFAEECTEHTIFADHYDFVISLILLEDCVRFVSPDAEEPEDAFDRFSKFSEPNCR